MLILVGHLDIFLSVIFALTDIELTLSVFQVNIFLRLISSPFMNIRFDIRFENVCYFGSEYFLTS